MKTIDEYLDEQINEQLCQAVLSGSKGEGPSKAKIRPVEIKGQVIYQVSETVGTKVLHRNYHREELTVSERGTAASLFTASVQWDDAGRYCSGEQEGKSNH